MTINDLPNLQVSRMCYMAGLLRIEIMITAWSGDSKMQQPLIDKRKRIKALLETVDAKIEKIESVNTPNLS